jgi:hypothetical protein
MVDDDPVCRMLPNLHGSPGRLPPAWILKGHVHRLLLYERHIGHPEQQM